MAKTIPSAFVGIDPDKIRPGTHILLGDALTLAQDQNFLFANCRQNVLHQDYRELDQGEGIHQGVGSGVSTTTGSYVERLDTHYVSRAITDNKNLVRVVTEATATTADGNVKVEFITVSGGATIETLTSTHASAGTQPSVVTTTAASTALDSDTEYRVKVSLQAGALGSIKLRRIDIEEIRITSSSDMP